MTLTGKCKEDFENWYLEYEIDNEMVDDLPPKEFYKLPSAMQFGVYVDFFDAMGYTIVIDSDWNFTPMQLAKGEGTGVKTFEYYVYFPDKKPAEYDSEFKTRSEARTKAIEKANEIYNESKLK